MGFLYYIRCVQIEKCYKNLLKFLSSYGAIVASFAFVTLSLGKHALTAMRCLWLRNLPASGLLYISELIEEHSRTSKVWGQRGIYVRLLF
jgi:hypothetical protein